MIKLRGVPFSDSHIWQGETGKIIQIDSGSFCPYLVLFDNGENIRFRFSDKEIVKLLNGIERAKQAISPKDLP